MGPTEEQLQAARREAADESRQQTLAKAYKRLQLLVGVLAILMPLAVVLGDLVIDGEGLRGSISSYYYGRTSVVFIGVLWAIGVTLIAYQWEHQHDFQWDRILTTAAGILAIGVALFPTSSTGSMASDGEKAVALVHLLCAAGTFLILSVIALGFFTKHADSGDGWNGFIGRVLGTEPAPANRQTQNLIYRVCGWTMVACMLLVLVSNAFKWGLLFWLEAVMVVAFALSWFTKALPRKSATPVAAEESE